MLLHARHGYLALHLLLRWEASSRKLLLLRYHAHVHILLMHASNLLLLLLELFDLLLQGKLLHCNDSTYQRGSSLDGMKAWILRPELELKERKNY